MLREEMWSDVYVNVIRLFLFFLYQIWWCGERHIFAWFVIK